MHRIHRLEQKVVLSLDGVFSVADVESLGPLSEVQQLEVRNQLDYVSWPRRLALPRLRVIYIDGPAPPLTELVEPGNLATVEHILIANAGRELSALGSPDTYCLRKLYIRQRKLTDDDIAWVQEHCAIEELCVTDSNVTDAFLRGLRSANSLQRLQLFRTQVSLLDSSLRRIRFHRVECLDVSECRIVDASVPILREAFPSVLDLRVQGNKLSLRAMKDLAETPGLTRLHCGDHEIDFDLVPYWRD